MVRAVKPIRVWGGTPRRTYAGVAALTSLLGIVESSERRVHRQDTTAYFFRTPGQTLGVAWRTGEGVRPLKPVAGVTVDDIMGNPVEPNAARLSETPLSLSGASADLVERAPP